MSQVTGIGIPDTGWYPRVFATQEGFVAHTLRSIADGIRSGIRLFFWPCPLDDSDIQGADGPAVILTTHRWLAEKLDSTSSSTAGFSFQMEETDGIEPRSFAALVDVDTLPNLPELKWYGHCLDESGQVIPGSGAAVCQLTDSIQVVSIPFDVNSAQCEVSEWCYRPFYSPAVGKHYVEAAPRLDFGALRRLLFRLLLSHGLQTDDISRLSPRMSDSNTVSIRIDADGYDHSQFGSLLDVAVRNEVTLTWFLDLFGLQKDHGLDFIRTLQEHGQDIQLHCYRHQVYQKRRVNELNLQRAVDMLQQRGVTPTGVVAPFGWVNEGYLRVVRDMGFSYASDFGAGVYDRPFQSDLAGQRLPLQVPTANASIGSMRRAGFSIDECFDHFIQDTRASLARDGSAIFYDHPIGGVGEYSRHFESFLNEMASDGATFVSMSEFADAACRRFSADACTKLDEDTWHVERFGSDAPLPPESAGDQFVHPGQAVSPLIARLNRKRKRSARRKAGWGVGRFRLANLTFDKLGW